MKDYLTYDDLADFYKRKTGRSTRILEVDDIYLWAILQKVIRVNKDTSLSFREEK
jgi:hypothetical protein